MASICTANLDCFELLWHVYELEIPEKNEFVKYISMSILVWN